MGNLITTGDIEEMAIKELRAMSPLAMAWLTDRIKNALNRVAFPIDCQLEGEQTPKEALNIAREGINDIVNELHKIGG